MKSTLNFKFFETEQDALKFCDAVKKHQSRYMNKHHAPSYHFWMGQDGSQAWLVWYHN